MTATPLRDLRTHASTTHGGLAMIEFQPTGLNPVGGPGQGEDWLEGSSQPVERLRARAMAAGREGHAVVAIDGEAGAGKLRVAQWIHRCSRRVDRPIMVLDAASDHIGSQLMRVTHALTNDSQLAPGTLAVRNLQEASQNTINRLLEIATGHPSAGGARCALILMSTVPYTALRGSSLQHGQLIGRGAAATIHVPALRDRTADVGLLARGFLEEAANRYGKRVRGLSPQALALLEQHDYPGNIHELRLLVEQAVLRATGDWITAEAFPGIGNRPSAVDAEATELVIRMPGSSLREIEMAALRLALKISGGRVVRASELLGITRHALRRKLEKFGLTELRTRYDNSEPDVHDAY